MSLLYSFPEGGSSTYVNTLDVGRGGLGEGEVFTTTFATSVDSVAGTVVYWRPVFKKKCFQLLLN